MDHGPNIKTGKDPASGFKQRIGIILFLIYSLIYLGFILINVFASDWMSVPVMAGMNLAVFYGFFLIIIAIVMGLIYNTLCSRAEKKMNITEDKP
jgi:uncharacterized membrane protein (DUF485 family)